MALQCYKIYSVKRKESLTVVNAYFCSKLCSCVPVDPETGQGHDQLGQRDGHPHSGHLPEGGQEKGDRYDEDQPTGQGEDLGRQGPVHRGEIGGQHDVEAGEGNRGEIQPKALCGDLLELVTVLAVEDPGHGGGEEKQDGVDQNGKEEHGEHSVAEIVADALGVIFAVGPADKGLDALGDSGID